VLQRQKTDYERRLKMAHLPTNHDLDKYDFNFAAGITKPQLQQLRELLWLEQNYNIILMGPSGTGKTYMAAGLVYQAIISGYRAYFMTMEEIVSILKMKEMTSTALAAYNRLLKAHLIAIDDIMLLPIKKQEAVTFFNMINHLPGQMITTIELKKVLCGTELYGTQEGIPEVIPVEMCYLSWQESLDKLKRLIEPNIPDA
jgi:DNA replication protein DnaC